jgi:hypothetical protein
MVFAEVVQPHALRAHRVEAGRLDRLPHRRRFTTVVEHGDHQTLERDLGPIAVAAISVTAAVNAPPALPPATTRRSTSIESSSACAATQHSTA